MPSKPSPPPRLKAPHPPTPREPSLAPKAERSAATSQEPEASSTNRAGLLEGEEQVRSVALNSSPAPPAQISTAARKRATGVLLMLAVLIGASYVVPALHRFRPWAPGEHYVPFWNIIGRELLGQGAAAEAEQDELLRLQALAVGTARAATHPAQSSTASSAPKTSPEPTASAPKVPVYPEYAGHPDDDAQVLVPIEQLSGLEHYYNQLTLVDMKVPGAIARAGHWGDSVLGNDGVTSAIRRRIQARFGDAGHGFHVLARYNLAYHHQGVKFRGRGSWQKCEIIFKCEKDGHYGYGGVSARSSGGGTGFWETTKQGIGQSVSRFELWYTNMPDGGRFQVKVDGHVDRIVDTRALQLGDSVEVIQVKEGAHSFEVRAIGEGVARGYGVVLENAGPGVVWDGLALIGSFTQRLDYQDPAHIAAQIKQRQADLLVFLLGGNDVQRETMDLYRTMQPYEEEYTRVLKKFRAGRPEASCLVMSLTDHAERVSRGVMRTRRIVPKMVDSQRKVALEQGCAFYNTFEAMGGKGSVVRWYRADPPLAGPDLAHPTTLGHEALAGLVYQALMKGYAEFRNERAGKDFEYLQEFKHSPPGQRAPREASNPGTADAGH